MSGKPELYIHVGQATHFLAWELAEFEKYFRLAEAPSKDYPLLSFGPDVLAEAARLPAKARFAVLLPGFAHNPLHNPEIRALHRELITEHFEIAFINPGPLEIAYEGLDSVRVYPVCVDTSLVTLRRYRVRLNSLLHASSDALQKDWTRSEQVMRLTGLRYEVFPPRNRQRRQRINHVAQRVLNDTRTMVGRPARIYPPHGYVSHGRVIKRYQAHDAFVHVARDVRDPIHVDGKYTATLIEAGLTGAILFWHDTHALGNDFESVIALPLDPEAASQVILSVRDSINVEAHSRQTREEMLEVADPARSVRVRAEGILEYLDGGPA